MEKRLLLAIVLSFVVLFGYQLLCSQEGRSDARPPAPTTAETDAPPRRRPRRPRLPRRTKRPRGEAPRPPLRAATPTAAAAAEIKTKIETSLFEAVWSNKGGVLLSWKLKKHLDEDKQPLELVPWRAETLGVHPFALLEDASGAVPTIDFAAIQADPLNASLLRASGRRSGPQGRREGRDPFPLLGRQGPRGREDLHLHRRDATISRPPSASCAAASRSRPRVLWGPGIGNPTAEELKKSFGAGGGMTALAGQERLPGRRGASIKPEQSLLNFAGLGGLRRQLFLRPVPARRRGRRGRLVRKDIGHGPRVLPGRQPARAGSSSGPRITTS